MKVFLTGGTGAIGPATCGICSRRVMTCARWLERTRRRRSCAHDLRLAGEDGPFDELHLLPGAQRAGA